MLAPGWTDYDRRIQYQTYDVTPLLAEGPNALGAVLGDGWFAGFFGFDPKHRGALYGARPQLLAQLDVEYEDGTTESLATDGSWSCSKGPILFSDLLMGESYDARREMPGWTEPGFDDSGWYGVETEEIGETNLVAQPDEGTRVTEELEAKTVTEPEGGRYVFDLGRNMVGWVLLKVEGGAGTRVTLRHAETLNPDGTIYTENLRSARQTDTYTLKGGGEEVYEPRFTFHGFRYVEVTGYPGEPRPGAITGRVVHSATPPSRVLRVLQLAGQRAPGEHRLGPARQLPERADRLPAARRAPRLDGRRPGLRPHRLLQHGRRRLLREVDGRRRGRPVSRRRLPRCGAPAERFGLIDLRLGRPGLG